MHTCRIANASLFVTVLSACLGLVATGVPAAYAQAPQEGVLSAIGSSQALMATATAAAQLTPQRALKLAATNDSYFQIGICQALLEPQENLYQNSHALADKHPHLVVTRLPRAGLARRS